MRDAFKVILKSGRKPLNLQTDQEKEYTKNVFKIFVKKENIHFFTTSNAETKASVVERFNSTLKSKIYKYLTWKNALKFVNVLSQPLESCNNSYHRSIKTKPILVNRTNEGKV